MKSIHCYLGFSYFLGIGPYRFDNLIRYFGDVITAYTAPIEDLNKVVSRDCAQKFTAFKKNFNPEKELESMMKNSISVLTREDSYFPLQLKRIADSPICLYVKGNKDALKLPLEQYFAIVGTRKASPNGLMNARVFAEELAGRGFVIVSGMALGIDGTAHRSALDMNGITVAVLGGGFNYIYPSSHQYLYEDILENAGAVISEFAPSQPALPGLFITRNRIISGLSKGILVVEGKKDSGAYSTGKFGLEQDKDVFAIPGSPNNELAETPNKLIQNGAYLTTDFTDVLIRFHMKVPRKKSRIKRSFSKDQKAIYTKLLKSAKTADDLAFELKRPIYEVLSIISQLEISGDIMKNHEGRYQII